MAAGVLGGAAVSRWFGDALLPSPGADNRVHAALSLPVGFALIWPALMIPVLGAVSFASLGVLALGATAVAVANGLREENPVPAPAPASLRETPRLEAAPEGSLPGDLASFPRATFLARTGAFFLDFLLVALISGLLGLGADRWLFTLLIAYHIALWAWKGATVGGIILQLRVVRTGGLPHTLPDALVRGLSSIFSVAVLDLGFFWILKDPERGVLARQDRRNLRRSRSQGLDSGVAAAPTTSSALSSPTLPEQAHPLPDCRLHPNWPELHLPWERETAVAKGDTPDLHCQVAVNTGLGRKFEEFEGPGLEVRWLGGHHEAAVGLTGERDLVQGQASEIVQQIGHGPEGGPRTWPWKRPSSSRCRRAGPSRRGAALGACTLGIVFLEEERRQRAAHVPLEVPCEHAAEYAGPDPVVRVDMDRTHFEPVGLEGPEGAFDA